MRALVTGGAGFIGSTLVDRLLAEGHEVDVVDDLSAGSLANLADARANRTKRLVIHQVDLRDQGVIELVARREPEVVFHLADQRGADARPEGVLVEAEVNVVGTLNLLEGVRRSGGRKVVFASRAASIYEPAEPADLPLRESHPQGPTSPHGVAKRAAVEYLSVYRDRYAIEYTALAIGDVYGPRCASGVVTTFVGRLRVGEACVIRGDGEQTRDFVYIDDVVDAFVRAADRGSGLTVNIGTGVETSINRLHATLQAVTGVAEPPLRSAVTPEALRRIALDPGRAAIHLGWKPWTSLEEGLRLTLAAVPA